MNDKIGPQHLERKAILYVRQSSSYQVQHNEESRRLQYAMQERMRSLGWVPTSGLKRIPISAYKRLSGSYSKSASRWGPGGRR